MKSAYIQLAAVMIAVIAMTAGPTPAVAQSESSTDQAAAYPEDILHSPA